MTEYRIVKGDVTPIIRVEIDGYDISSDDWTCRVVVKDKIDRDAQALIDKTAPKLQTEDGTYYFQCYLTPDETETLAENGIYFWIFEIENSQLTVPFRKEVQNRLIVSPSAV